MEAADDFMDGPFTKLAVSSSTHSRSGVLSFNITAMVGIEEVAFGRSERMISRLILISSGAFLFSPSTPGLFMEQISRCITC